LTIVAILLVVLALLSTTSTVTSLLNVGRRPPGAFNGNGAAGGNFQQGNNGAAGGNFQGGADANGGTRAAGGNFQGGNRAGGTNIFSLLRNTGINFQVIGYVSQGLTILGILLALLCAYGVWKQKRWGLNWGMVLALIFLIGAAPALFSLGGRNINWLRTATTILTVVATLPILVYGILPSVRDFVS
jgi:hypothetical protein